MPSTPVANCTFTHVAAAGSGRLTTTIPQSARIAKARDGIKSEPETSLVRNQRREKPMNDIALLVTIVFFLGFIAGYNLGKRGRK